MISSPLLRLPGAVEADAPDAGTAAHYGDPFREQRDLARSGAADPVLVDLSSREVITVSGEDRATWLTTLSSQVLTGLPEGASAELALLSAQGRIEWLPRAVVGPDRIWLVVEQGQGAGLAAFLESMRFMLRVEVQDVTQQWAVVGSVADPALADQAMAAAGTEAAARRELLEPWTGGLVWRDPWPGVVEGGWAYARTEGHPAESWRWYETLVPRTALTAWAEAGNGATENAGLRWAGVLAAEALRVEAWRPRAGREADERSIPHELDLLRTAVHLAKGCYKGQETVARVHNLGHPPRRLVFLDLDGSEHTLPAVGSAVVAGSRTVGTVTSVAHHHEAGPIALAVIKRSVDPQAPLTVLDPGAGAAAEADGAAVAAEPVAYAARQTVVVPPEAGQVAGRHSRHDFLR